MFILKNIHCSCDFFFHLTFPQCYPRIQFSSIRSSLQGILAYQQVFVCFWFFFFFFTRKFVKYYSPQDSIKIFKYFTSNSFIIWIQTDFYHIIKGILAPVTIFPSFIKMSKGIIWFSSIPCQMFKRIKSFISITDYKFCL